MITCFPITVISKYIHDRQTHTHTYTRTHERTSTDMHRERERERKTDTHSHTKEIETERERETDSPRETKHTHTQKCAGTCIHTKTYIATYKHTRTHTHTHTNTHSISHCFLKGPSRTTILIWELFPHDSIRYLGAFGLATMALGHSSCSGRDARALGGGSGVGSSIKWSGFK